MPTSVMLSYWSYFPMFYKSLDLASLPCLDCALVPSQTVELVHAEHANCN